LGVGVSANVGTVAGGIVGRTVGVVEGTSVGSGVMVEGTVGVGKAITGRQLARTPREVKRHISFASLLICSPHQYWNAENGAVSRAHSEIAGHKLLQKKLLTLPIARLFRYLRGENASGSVPQVVPGIRPPPILPVGIRPSTVIDVLSLPQRYDLFGVERLKSTTPITINRA
jgi:hypothetical protein